MIILALAVGLIGGHVEVANHLKLNLQVEKKTTTETICIVVKRLGDNLYEIQPITGGPIIEIDTQLDNYVIGAPYPFFL